MVHQGPAASHADRLATAAHFSYWMWSSSAVRAISRCVAIAQIGLEPIIFNGTIQSG
jgi:hypothetical protein